MANKVTPQCAAAELLRRDRAKESLLDFAKAIDIPGKPVSGKEEEWVFYPVETGLAVHHSLMLKVMEDVILGNIPRAMFFLPPGSAKSIYGSVVAPTWAMGKIKGLKIILASYGSDLAKKHGRRARQIVRDKKYTSIFDTQISSDTSAADEWALDNGSEYMATGILGGITGNRANGIVIDDPIKGREQADSETIRNKTWEAYQDDLRTRLMPGGWEILIQTRWHEDDLAGRILPANYDGENGMIECRDGRKWYVVCIPAECEKAGDPLGRKIGEYLWPEWFTEKHFEGFKSIPRTWNALFQQRPRPSGGGEFQRQWVNFYGCNINHSQLQKVLLVDPAGEKKNHSDYTSMWVVGLGGDENYYVLDMVRDKLNLTERCEAVFRLHRRWKPQQVRYEKYSMQADIEFIRSEMNRRTYRFRITEVGGSTAKNDRIRRLVPYFQRGNFWFPDSLAYTGYDGVLCDLVQSFIEEELLPFPVGKHDDMLDSLARIVEPGLDIPIPSDESPNVYRDAGFQPFNASMGW